MCVNVYNLNIRICNILTCMLIYEHTYNIICTL